MPNPQRSILAAVTLFFVAPFVAEFLLGDFPPTYLPLLILFAPMYGGGALLIRELARRTGRGWPTMLLLGCSYCLIEEGFSTQSLFNPNAFGLHLHLLASAWIPALGIGGWWTIFMLNVHPFWSIGVSIALVEGLFPSRASTPWLGKAGDSAAAVLFAAGFYVNTLLLLRRDPFRASHTQLAVTGVVCILFAAAAFLVPARAVRAGVGAAPSPWLTGAGTFVLGAAVFLAPVHWNWAAVAWIVADDLVFLLLLRVFSRRAGWTMLHTLSIGAAGALVYGVHAFITAPVVPAPMVIVLAGHALFLFAALALIAPGIRRTRAVVSASPPLTPVASV
jgi:hypothetical protein